MIACSERAHIDIAKIKNEDGSTTEVNFYHNKSGLYESDKHYNDVDILRNHSFYLSENGRSLAFVGPVKIYFRPLWTGQNLFLKRHSS